MNNVYLLTGGNLGDRKANLLQASNLIEQSAGCLVARSGIYETAAWGMTDQDAFLNQVLLIQTPLVSHKLLQTLLSIEEQMGRKRGAKFGPRVIDIDILFYNNEIIKSIDLTVPHPEIQNRRFVLVPLNEIAFSLIHPVFNKTINQLLVECKDPLKVNVYN
jgi:2-amino-4-hydroxy-6-hydroxymethyldihydropteridine diphosphokinase